MFTPPLVPYLDPHGVRLLIEGAALALDQHWPGWADRVDEDHFRLADAGMCVLFYAAATPFERQHHVNGVYSRALDVLSKSNPQAERLYDAYGVFASDVFRPYWLEAISRRRNPQHNPEQGEHHSEPDYAYA